MIVRFARRRSSAFSRLGLEELTFLLPPMELEPLMALQVRELEQGQALPLGLELALALKQQQLQVQELEPVRMERESPKKLQVRCLRQEQETHPEALYLDQKEPNQKEFSKQPAPTKLPRLERQPEANHPVHPHWS